MLAHSPKREHADIARKEYFDARGNFIAGGTASDEGRERALRLHQAAMAQQDREPRISYGGNRHHEVYRKIKTDECLFCAGLLRREEMHPDADVYQSFDLVRCARDFIALAGGEPPPGDARATVIQRALGSSDFPSLLNSIVHKALMTGYAVADTTWQYFCAQRTVPDYKTFLTLRGASMRIPPLVQERGEISIAGLADEGAEASAIERFVQIFSISRQALANGDLEKITLTPAAAGAAGARRVNKSVYDLMLSNPVMSDNVTMFHATHNNLIDTGSGAAPSVTSLSEACLTMGNQTNSFSEFLNLRPSVLIAPHSMAPALTVLRNSMISFDPADPSTGRIVIATDSHLSGTGWYAFSNPYRHPAMAVVTLQGQEVAPYLEELTKAPIGSPDGRHWRVSLDFVPIVTDHKAAFFNAGA